MRAQPCLFCGGDDSEPNHWARCDGRQGALEAAEDLPMFVSGLTPDTYATSEAAAISVEDARSTLREEVYRTIAAAGAFGRTDDEVQELLGLDGNTERPRRCELWKLDRIRMRRGDDELPIRRLTRSGRRAVVWIASEA